MLRAWAELDLARALVSAGDEERGDRDFVVKVRHSTEKALAGEGPDALQAQTRTELARDWCNRHKLQTTFKATFSRYGFDTSNILARAWCHRMQYFWDMEMASWGS